MSARDDYPAIAVHARFPGAEGRQCYDALEEIDRWRARWDTYSTLFDRLAEMGSKIEYVKMPEPMGEQE